MRLPGGDECRVIQAVGRENHGRRSLDRLVGRVEVNGVVERAGGQLCAVGAEGGAGDIHERGSSAVMAFHTLRRPAHPPLASR